MVRLLRMAFSNSSVAGWSRYSRVKQSVCLMQLPLLIHGQLNRIPVKIWPPKHLNTDWVIFHCPQTPCTVLIVWYRSCHSDNSIVDMSFRCPSDPIYRSYSTDGLLLQLSFWYQRCLCICPHVIIWSTDSLVSELIYAITLPSLYMTTHDIFYMEHGSWNEYSLWKLTFSST